jgi:hypothetical protein
MKLMFAISQIILNIRQSSFSHQKIVSQYPQNKHLLNIAPAQCRCKYCFVLQLLQNPTLCRSTILEKSYLGVPSVCGLVDYNTEPGLQDPRPHDLQVGAHYVIGDVTKGQL